MILANLKQFVQRPGLKRSQFSRFFGFLLVLLISCPGFAQEATPQNPSEQESEPEYVSGQVTEILSETTIQDEAFGRQEKKFRFKVHFNAQGKEPEETILLEQSYSLDTPSELLPRKGKHFIFYKETMVDNTHAYTLIDVQRLNHVPWIAFIVALALILFGRWYGIKALLIGGGMLICFMLFQLIKFPWLLNSVITFAAVSALACLLTFGSGPRLIASLLSTLLGGAFTLLLVWISSWFSISSPSVLLGSGMILQMSAGLSYIAISTVTAMHVSWRNEPGQSPKSLYQKGLLGGRGSIEIVASIYLVFVIGQLLTSVYSQGGDPGMLQMEPILTEMAGLLFMLLGFSFALPLSALLGSRFLIKSRR